jgi:hypothetical protein
VPNCVFHAAVRCQGQQLREAFPLHAGAGKIQQQTTVARTEISQTIRSARTDRQEFLVGFNVVFLQRGGFVLVYVAILHLVSGTFSWTGYTKTVAVAGTRPSITRPGSGKTEIGKV